MKAKFWGHRKTSGAGEFVMLANARSSSSCRRFDARSGAAISLNSGSRQTYDMAYGTIYRECTEVTAPPAARTEDMQAGLPAAYLVHLQKQVGIEPAAGAAAAQPSIERRSMLAGTTELIERTLKLSYGLKTKSAVQALSVAPAGFDSLRLIADLYALIEKNWDRSSGRSEELWRWEAQTKIGADNQSLEKTLEKAIVVETGEWVNQIPAAPGLLKGVEESHMNVDLARRCGPSWFELVELKVGPNADTPVWAAFEILRYGLLYCFARFNRSNLHLPKAHTLMGAQRIDLKVLAPNQVYAGHRLAWLEESLNSGLQEFSRQRFSGVLTLRFQFETFPADFRWPDEDTARLRRMFASRSRCAF